VQRPPPFLERLKIDTAELRTDQPARQGDALFSSSAGSGEREGTLGGSSMVGNMLSKVRVFALVKA